MFVPELKIPVASARSFFGNHSATALIEAGKFPASPRPRIRREKARPAVAPMLHATTATAKPRLTPIRSMIRPESSRPMA